MISVFSLSKTNVCLHNFLFRSTKILMVFGDIWKRCAFENVRAVASMARARGAAQFQAVNPQAQIE